MTCPRCTRPTVHHCYYAGNEARRCDRCRAGQENICRTPEVRAGFTEPGGFQERLVAPIDRLTPVPPGIDAVHAAPLTCA